MFLAVTRTLPSSVRLSVVTGFCTGQTAYASLYISSVVSSSIFTVSPGNASSTSKKISLSVEVVYLDPLSFP